MKKTFTERNLVIILFVMVLITFSFAQQDSKKLEKLYIGFKAATASPLTSANRIHLPDQNKSEFKTQSSRSAN